MCVCVCVCVPSLTSDASETVEVIIVKLVTVTASDMRLHHVLIILIASDMRLHHVLIILTLTFIEGHTDQNHESIKCSIISETIKAVPIKFAVMIVGLKI